MITTLRTFMISMVALGNGLQPSFSQGTFANLGFEAATIPAVPPNLSGGTISVSNGLPGWTALIGTTEISWIFHNDVSLGAASISILGPQWSSLQILDGAYTVLLQPAFPGGSPIPAIAQVGRIPNTARSLRFYAQGAFEVTFGGQQLPLVMLGSPAGNFSVYGGDVTLLAGTTEELRFAGGGLLDNIFFSSEPIPEPNALGLFVIGGLLLGWRLGRHRGPSHNKRG